MKLSKVYLVGFGFFTLAFGLAYLFAPALLTEPAGFGSLSPSATTDVRATYGGFQIGIGLFLLWSSRAPARFHSGLMVACFSIGAVLASRILGLALDGDLSEFHRSGLATEVILTLASLYVLRKTTQEDGGANVAFDSGS